MNGKAKVTLRLKRFVNTNDKLWGGGSCDGLLGGACENEFEICVKGFPPLPSSFSSCMYYKKTSSFSGTTVDFERTSTGINRDIVLNFDTYSVRAH